MSVSETATLIYTTLFKPKILRKGLLTAVKFIIKEKIQIGDITLFLNKNDGVVSGALSLNLYENDFFNIIMDEINAGDTFLDIGANIGLYSCSAANAIGSQGTCIGIEPDDENFSFLEKNKKVNNLDNLIVLNRALGEKNGTTKLFINNENRGDHRIYDADGLRNYKEIQISTLDSLVDEIKLAKIDVVKIDTQGADFMILKGMQKSLNKFKALKIFIEFWPWGLRKAGSCPKGMIQFIREQGFSILDATTKEPFDHDKIDKMIALNRERDHLNFFLVRQ